MEATQEHRSRVFCAPLAQVRRRKRACQSVWLHSLMGMAFLCLLLPAREGNTEETIAQQAPWGVVGPDAGDFVARVGGGLLLNLPAGGAGVRLGLGAGTVAEINYLTVGFLGHNLDVRLGWGTGISEHVALGLQLSSSLSTLELANDLAGVAFDNICLRNDLSASAEFVATWIRPGSASVTASFGTSMTVGGPRYQDFFTARYELEPELRSFFAVLQGEWLWGESRFFYMRLEALMPVSGRIVPLGYLPTLTAGVAWVF